MGQESGICGGLSEDLWKLLTGKKIVLAGMETIQRQRFREILTNIAKNLNHIFTVTEEFASVGADDYVLIFAGGEADQKLHRGYAERGVQEMHGTYAACRTQTQLWDVLAETEQRQPKAVLLVSSNLVYGKCFGTPRARTEHELGYVCHTASADAAAEQLRIAENLAYRLAKETGLHIGIVRVDESCQDAQMGACAVEDTKRTAQTVENTGSAETKMIEAAIRALLYGEPGEVYNLPGEDYTLTDSGDYLPGAGHTLPDSGDNLLGAGHNPPNQGDNLSDEAYNLSEAGHSLSRQSPLSPIRIVTDTKKVQALIRK